MWGPRGPRGPRLLAAETLRGSGLPVLHDLIEQRPKLHRGHHLICRDHRGSVCRQRGDMFGLYQGLFRFAVTPAPQVFERVTNVIALAPIGLAFHALEPGDESIYALNECPARIGIGISGWGHDRTM